MRRIFVSLSMVVAIVSLLTACASSPISDSELPHSNFGLLLMAHGGGEEWNQGVIDSLRPLRQEFPVEVAFGMADAVSLQAAVSKLEQQGVNHIGVVRLFVSGDSWYQRTLQILGVMEGAPTKPIAEPEAHNEHSSASMPFHSMEFWRIETSSAFSVSKEGLAAAREMDEVLLTRVRELSENAEQESVVILAHGPGDDAENEEWLKQIRSRTAAIEQEMGIRNIAVFTLREDWQQKRVLAEQQIVNHVRSENEKGLSVIVIPFRVQGFGPYAEVLAGLSYIADHQGLIPHGNVTEWIRNQAELARQWSFRECS